MTPLLAFIAGLILSAVAHAWHARELKRNSDAALGLAGSIRTFLELELTRLQARERDLELQRDEAVVRGTFAPAPPPIAEAPDAELPTEVLRYIEGLEGDEARTDALELARFRRVQSPHLTGPQLAAELADL